MDELTRFYHNTMDSYRDKMSEDNVVCAVFFLLCLYSHSLFSSLLGISYFFVVFCLASVVLKRFVAYKIDPYYHKNSMFWHIFDMNKITCIVFAVCLSLVIFNWNSLESDIWMCITGYFFVRTIKYDSSVYRRSYEMFNSSGLDYGSGMAYSFFHGYLAILLPNKGDDNTGIEELMTRYEDNHNIKFLKKKLFILVPSKLYCPPDLKEMSGKNGGPTLEAAMTLDSVHRNRAGVINRTYKNSVYKIKDGSSPPLYVVAEGATPLQTLFNSLNSTSDHCEFYNMHKADIVRMFYKTLVYLIESDVECRDRCEVVYFNNDNVEPNVAEILKNRILKAETKASLNYN